MTTDRAAKETKHEKQHQSEPPVREEAFQEQATPTINLARMGQSDILRLQRVVGNQNLQHLLTQASVPRSSHRIPELQRKDKSGSSTGGSSASTPSPDVGVGIAGGESKTASDQDNLAPGYIKRADGQYDTPYKRVVSEEQAKAESKVLTSEGIFMGAYLARYNHLKSPQFGLAQPQLDELSRDAGFMKQFQTGDIVMRLMSAEDSAAIAKITDSHYSHSGIVQRKADGVWVLDSYPRGASKPGKEIDTTGSTADDSQLIRFEEFFSDHEKEQVINGIVLRMQGITDQVRNDIDHLINIYNVKVTKFDFRFRIDNGDDILYCSELVRTIFVQAKATVLPPNEFQEVQDRVNNLITMLKALAQLQKPPDPHVASQIVQLEALAISFQTAQNAGANELYSPGSLERTKGLDTIAGFTRDGTITGDFKVIAVRATLPNDTWDTPDAYVKGAGHRTLVKDDTTTPVWNEAVATVSYESLRDFSLEVWDEDVLSDDRLAAFSADLRPVRPDGQTFTLEASGVTLVVKVEGEASTGATAAQAPRHP